MKSTERNVWMQSLHTQAQVFKSVNYTGHFCTFVMPNGGKYKIVARPERIDAFLKKFESVLRYEDRAVPKLRNNFFAASSTNSFIAKLLAGNAEDQKQGYILMGK